MNLAMTPEARAEVGRNLIITFALAAGGVLILVLILSLAINPPGGTAGFRLGSLLLIAFALPGMAVAACCLILAYPLGCWPGFMRAKKLSELYGIDAEGMSNKAIRGRMRQMGYWLAFARGAAVAAPLAALWFFGWWASHPGRFPEGFVFPALYLCVFGGGIASRAWVARDLFERRS